MARDHARVNVTIWGDPNFRRLPPPAQHLYMLLWTAPDLSYCGVHDWRPARLTGLAEGWTRQAIETAAACLEARHFLVIDHDTEEVMIRSWIRWDGLMKQPRMAISCITAYASVASPTIREVIVHQLAEEQSRLPDLACWADERVQEVLSHPSVDPKSLPLPEDPFRDGFTPGFTPSGTPGFGVGLGQTQSKVWTPSTPAPAPAPNSSTPAPYKAPPVSTSPGDDHDHGHALETVSPDTLFPRNWTPSTRHRAYALENQLDLTHEAHMFREHAHANGRTAVDWDAAFMTWLGKARPRTRPGTATGTNRAMTALELAAQYEAQEDQDRAAITDRQAAR